MAKMRVGIGYDVHALTTGRKLVLGGVEIPFDKGLSGWSDADVLTHAIMDAMLGAATMADIGTHFPSGDPQYKNVSSLVLLGKVRALLAKAGWQVNNVDATVVAERPRLREYIDRMREKLSQILRIDVSQVSVKAGTSERLGFVGREEGIAVYAIVSVEAK